MTFTQMRDLLNKHFDEVMKPQPYLFEVQMDKEKMWNVYLNSYPEGTNKIFRTRTEHDCSCCRGFIKQLGNVVAIIDGKVISIWDFECDDPVYGPVIKTMSEFVHNHDISDVYLSIFRKIGCHHNFELVENGDPIKWNHFYTELDEKFVTFGAFKGTKLNELRTAKSTFKRALDEIDMSAVDTLLELIADNSIYRGQEWTNPLKIFKEHKIVYMELTSEKDKELYAWEHSVKLGRCSITGIRNTSIGTLLVDISEGKDLEQAVRSYEAITDPNVYKRPKPIFTEKMRQEAEKKITELGFMSALARRFAKIDDITINDILFVDRSVSRRLKGSTSIFDELAKDVKTKPKKFDRVETIPIQKFITDVLPTIQSIEAYVENSHKSNFVSLIAPQDPDARSMFKWGNNYTWAYTGNVTDSFKQKVKEFGGNIEGVLRFSIKWNEDGKDSVDLDAHCITPNGREIYFGNKFDVTTRGELDVDIIDPNRQVTGSDKTAVENITWGSKKFMTPGQYKFFVYQYSGSVRNGFRAEIEFDGNIYAFDYPNSMRTHEAVEVATVTLHNDGTFTIDMKLDSTNTSKNIWNIDTNNFIPVTSIMYSPNYWSTADKNIGHQHIFFMLDGCVNNENPSGIFNEFLVSELDENKRVMAALGNKMRVEDTDDQLSGLGFALDKKAELVVRVTGTTERILKIQF